MQWLYEPGFVLIIRISTNRDAIISACHLSTPMVTQRLYRSTLQLERAALITLVYMNFQLLKRTARHVTMLLVGSYPTFSPSPTYSLHPKMNRNSRQFFSSTLAYPYGQLAINKQDALCCPDFPPIFRRRPATNRTTAYSRLQRYAKFISSPLNFTKKTRKAE